MVIELCRCSWNIPGVEALPPHWHVSYRPGMDDIHICVPWRDVARAWRQAASS